MLCPLLGFSDAVSTTAITLTHPEKHSFHRVQTRKHATTNSFSTSLRDPNPDATCEGIHENSRAAGLTRKSFVSLAFPRLSGNAASIHTAGTSILGRENVRLRNSRCSDAALSRACEAAGELSTIAAAWSRQLYCYEWNCDATTILIPNVQKYVRPRYALPTVHLCRSLDTYLASARTLCSPSTATNCAPRSVDPRENLQMSQLRVGFPCTLVRVSHPQYNSFSFLHPFALPSPAPPQESSRGFLS